MSIVKYKTSTRKQDTHGFSFRIGPIGRVVMTSILLYVFAPLSLPSSSLTKHGPQKCRQ